MTRDEVLHMISNERARQFNLPGREFDVNNSPNDWSAIIGRYVFDEIRRGQRKPSRKEFETNLIKAAAVILATLEHCPMMEKNHFFEEE